MKNFKYSISLCLIIAVMLWSCKPLQPVQNNVIKPVPVSYDGNADTVSDGTLSWKHFFQINI